MRFRLLPIALLVTVVAAAALPAPAGAQTKTTLTFSAGPTGGNWTPLAAATADVVRKRFPEVDVQVEPGTGQANMEKLLTDRTDLGWSTTTIVFDARAGKGRWKDKPADKLRYVAAYYATPWHLAVPADSDIRKIADLKGKNVAMPQRASASMECFELLLNLNGVKLEDLGAKSYGSFAQNVEMLKNRQAVAMGWLVTAPAPFMLDLGSSMKVRLIPVPDDIVEKARQANGGYVRHVLRKETYAGLGIDADVVTVQAPTVLMASSRVPPDTIYKLAKAIVEGREAFAHVASVMKGIAAAELAQNVGIPYHPGAERYYREAGLLK